MSKLQDFLNKNVISDQTEEVIISDRFQDEKGELLKFKIKSIPMGEYKAFQKSCTKMSKNGAEFDAIGFNEKMVIAGVVDPNFKEAESIKSLGCTTPEQYLNKVLLPGEVLTLANKIFELSGFKDFSELVEEAKN